MDILASILSGTDRTKKSETIDVSNPSEVVNNFSNFETHNLRDLHQFWNKDPSQMNQKFSTERSNLSERPKATPLTPSYTFSSVYHTGEKRLATEADSLTLKKSRSMFASLGREESHSAPQSSPYFMRKHASVEPWMLQNVACDSASRKFQGTMSVDDRLLSQGIASNRVRHIGGRFPTNASELSLRMENHVRNIARQDSGCLESVVKSFFHEESQSLHLGDGNNVLTSSGPDPEVSNSKESSSLLSFLAGNYPHLAHQTGVKPKPRNVQSGFSTLRKPENGITSLKQRSWTDSRSTTMAEPSQFFVGNKLELKSNKGIELAKTSLFDEVQKISTSKLKRSMAQEL